MLAALVGLIAVTAGHSTRKVRWYVNTANTALDVVWFHQHHDVVSSVILTENNPGGNTSRVAGLLTVLDNGTVSHSGTGSAEDYLIAAAQPYKDAGLTVYVGVTISEDAILHGEAAKEHVTQSLVNAVLAANITGIMVDYEPRTAITLGHQKLYQAFISTLGICAHSKGIEMGIAVAVSGILQPSQSYASLSGLSWASSMDPTLYSTSALSQAGELFVRSMRNIFTAARTSVGIGSVSESPTNCKPDYQWSRLTLAKFLAELDVMNISSVDILPCNLEKKGSPSVAHFFTDVLRTWLSETS